MPFFFSSLQKYTHMYLFVDCIYFKFYDQSKTDL